MADEKDPKEANPGEGERDPKATAAGDGESAADAGKTGDGDVAQPSWQEEREELLREAEERALRRLRAEQAQPTDKPAPAGTDHDAEVTAIIAENNAIREQVRRDNGFTADTLQRKADLQDRILAVGLARMDRELANLKHSTAAEKAGNEPHWLEWFEKHKGEGTPGMLRKAWMHEQAQDAIAKAERAKKDAEATKAAASRKMVDNTTRDVTAREVTVRKMTQAEFDQRQRVLIESGREAEARQEQRDYRRGKIEVTTR